jgi:hypothetical protein
VAGTVKVESAGGQRNDRCAEGGREQRMTGQGVFGHEYLSFMQ